jgi:hypothetical protein
MSTNKTCSCSDQQDDEVDDTSFDFDYIDDKTPAAAIGYVLCAAWSGLWCFLYWTRYPKSSGRKYKVTACCYCSQLLVLSATAVAALDQAVFGSSGSGSSSGSQSSSSPTNNVHHQLWLTLSGIGILISVVFEPWELRQMCKVACDGNGRGKTYWQVVVDGSAQLESANYGSLCVVFLVFPLIWGGFCELLYYEHELSIVGLVIVLASGMAVVGILAVIVMIPGLYNPGGVIPYALARRVGFYKIARILTLSIPGLIISMIEGASSAWAFGYVLFVEVTDGFTDTLGD